MTSKFANPKRSARSPRAKAPRALSGTVFITRQVHFNSAHRLHNPTKSQAWNTQQYGLCTNPHWHGHNYVLEVTLSGQPDPLTGYIVDLGELKRILHRAVVDKCDHRNLNADVDFLRDVIPSTENLVIAFWHEIEPHIKAGKLHCVRLYETPRNFVEFFGPEVRPA
ncbi:MAG: 6-pyruvoyl tetrahydrobiopterin synthase [Opitutia bacterium]|nr:6-carboxytetrahydropterin synthase [Opitutaceae bacterium]PHX70800.1 MAG: 6-pyruvoyl tetrahydrobiopterin synthase [Opitutae bacterium]